jgi:uncharacterized membrane protein YczE
VRRVRTLTELTVLIAGWAMGGAIGVGTVLFALTAGPAMQLGLRVFRALPASLPPARETPVRWWPFRKYAA